jgi:hypothetical protein
MAELEVERIAQDRYRLRFRGQLMTVDAQALLDIMDWALRYAKQLEEEALPPRIPPGHSVSSALDPHGKMKPS